LIKSCLNTAWLTGFIDAEGSFSARIRPCKISRLGKAPHLSLTISQKDDSILKEIRKMILGSNSTSNISYDKS
jgi:hypothetical protein